MAVTSSKASPAAAPSVGRRPLAAVWELIRLEMRLGLRGAAFRNAAGLALLLGLVVGGAEGRGVAASAWAAGQVAWQVFAFVVIVWMSLAAVRETSLRTDALVFSKPQSNETLILSRFLGALGQLALATAALYLGAIIGRLLSGGGLLGFGAYLTQYGRSLGVLFFAASASFTLALLARTVTAGILVGFYWIVTLGGKSFLAKAVFPYYSQNLAAYTLLGVFLLCIALWFYRPSRRGGHGAPLAVRILSAAALGLCVMEALRILNTGHDPIVRLDPRLELMREQHVELGLRAPGFTLPDGSGRLVSPTDFPDKVLVIALWSPDNPEAARMLSHLAAIQSTYGKRGVQVLAICLSEDEGAAWTFGAGLALPFPVVQDWGTHHSPKTEDKSPMADAYRTELLPRLVVTDRRRITRDVINVQEGYHGRDLAEAIEERLREEPQ
jgi:peroxiredoxin